MLWVWNSKGKAHQKLMKLQEFRKLWWQNAPKHTAPQSNAARQRRGTRINQLAPGVEKAGGKKTMECIEWSEAAGRTRRRRRRASSSSAACGAPPRRLGAPATGRCSPSLAGNSLNCLDRLEVGCARGNGRSRMGRSGLIAFQTLGGGRGRGPRCPLAFRGEPNIGVVEHNTEPSLLPAPTACLLFHSSPQLNKK